MGNLVAGANWSDDALHAFLFGYDDSTSQLGCVRATAPAGHPLAVEKFRWGHGIVGMAFRARRASDYSKSEYVEGSEILDNFPDLIRVACAIPLWGAPAPISNWPLAVAVLASTSADSGLLTICDDDDAFEAICYRAECVATRRH